MSVFIIVSSSSSLSFPSYTPFHHPYLIRISFYYAIHLNGMELKKWVIVLQTLEREGFPFFSFHFLIKIEFRIRSIVWLTDGRGFGGFAVPGWIHYMYSFPEEQF